MINTRIYSQRDWRWYWKRVGFGKGHFGSVGCTVTSLTGLLFVAGYDLHPSQVAEKLRGVGAFIGDLLYWSKIERTFPNVKFVWRFYKYDNVQVKKLVDAGIPVLVEVLKGGARHWTLFLGDKKMLDPWTGKVVSTSLYKAIGYAVFSIKP